MTYFKTFVTCAFSAFVVAGLTSMTYHAENPSTIDDPAVEIIETTDTAVAEEDTLEKTDWYYETERGSYIVSTPYGVVETMIHPTQLDFTPVCETTNELTSESEVQIAEVHSVALAEKPYSVDSFDVTTYQVNKSYDIPAEFYYSVLPEDMHCLVEGICNLERTQNISSMFLFAVAATEVGWHGEFAGDNNWFNWTPDAETYQGFSSVDECIVYTGERFKDYFFNPAWYAEFGQTVDDYFTIAEINSRYAFYDDCSVNWYWGEVVSEILDSLNTKYMRWLTENYG